MKITNCGRGVHKREVVGVARLQSLPSHWHAFTNLDLAVSPGLLAIFARGQALPRYKCLPFQSAWKGGVAESMSALEQIASAITSGADLPVRLRLSPDLTQPGHMASMDMPTAVT
jgi:hypothetical protein